MAHFETQATGHANPVEFPSHSERSDGLHESPFFQELNKTLNTHVPGGPQGDKPGPIANTVASLAREGQTAFGNGDWAGRTASFDKLNGILGSIKSPEEMQNILAQADQLLAKDNIKLVSNSDGSVWEGLRDQETSPFYPVVELYEPKPAAGP